MSVCQTSIFNRKKHQIKCTTLKSFSTKKEIRALIKDVQKREERERERDGISSLFFLL